MLAADIKIVFDLKMVNSDIASISQASLKQVLDLSKKMCFRFQGIYLRIALLNYKNKLYVLISALF